MLSSLFKSSHDRILLQPFEVYQPLNKLPLDFVSFQLVIGLLRKRYKIVSSWYSGRVVWNQITIKLNSSFKYYYFVLLEVYRKWKTKVE